MVKSLISRTLLEMSDNDPCLPASNVAEDTVDMVRLKELARSTLGEDSIFRALILSEPDQVPKQDFVVKVGMWLKVLDKELQLLDRS